MLNDFIGADRVYIACGYTDLRKGIDGLAAMVQQEFELDPFLDGFAGYLQTDGDAGYNGVGGAIRIGCWAHARRKLDEALKAVPKGRRSPTA